MTETTQQSGAPAPVLLDPSAVAQHGLKPHSHGGGTVPEQVARRAHALVRRGRLPGADRARGGVAVHADGPAARAARGARQRRRRRHLGRAGSGRRRRSRTSSPGRRPRGSALGPGRPGRGRSRRPARPRRCTCKVAGRGRAGRAGAGHADRRGRTCAATAHTVIEAGRHSKATVVLDHVGSGQHAGNVEIVVGDGADLTVVSLQHWDDDAVHLGQHDARVGRDARFKHVVVSPRRRRRAGQRQRRVRRPRRRRRAARPLLRRRRPAPRAPLFVDHSAPHCRAT